MSRNNAIAAIILAAGESRRMGYPKALVKYHDRPFLSEVTQTFRAAGISRTVIVLGANADEIITNLQLHEKEYVINENFRDGQFSSFQRGIRHVYQACEAVFLALVDQPQIPAEVVNKLLRAHQDLPERIIIPTAFGRRGHPTIFPASLFQNILQYRVQRTARDVISDFESIVSEIEVGDERILWNINDKKELNAVKNRLNLKEETWAD